MINHKPFCISLLSVFFIYSSCLKSFAYDEVNIATVIYPPIVSEKFIPGLGYGIMRDLVTESFKAVSVRVNYDLLPMSRNVWTIVQEIDSICLGSMAWFKKNNKAGLVEYVEIINLNFMAFYKKSKFPDGVTFNSLKDLKKYRFGNVRGSGSQQTFDNAKLTTDLAQNIRQNFLKLNAERVDFAVSFEITGNYLIKELFPKNVSNFARLNKPLLNSPISLIFLKHELNMKLKFLKGLRIIAKNGTYYNILKRYYGEDGIPDGAIPEFIKRDMSTASLTKKDSVHYRGSNQSTH